MAPDSQYGNCLPPTPHFFSHCLLTNFVMWCRVIFLFVIVCISEFCVAQITEKLWTNISNDNNKLALELDETTLRSQLNSISQNENLIVEIPHPSGKLQAFVFKKSQIMETELADKFPEIQTYTGYCKNNLQAECRLSVSKKGVYGMVKNEKTSYYFNPIKDNKYSCHFISNRGEDFSCSDFNENLSERLNIYKEESNDVNYKSVSDGNYRQYKIAIAATAEYTNFHGGSIEDGLAAVVNTLTRVNFIFERELAIGFVLVNNNDLLIETDVENDPYDNFSLVQMMAQNQATIDARIGSENYDVGHLFGTHGGGMAVQLCPCNKDLKAYGVTGISSPTGEEFDVNFVAHEIAHQFGAKHTFNSETGQCQNNRSEESAYEPGSGTTIMAYQGLCGNDNISEQTDAYFHSASLEQITKFVTKGHGSNCGEITSIQNNDIEVNAGSDYVIPPLTSFVLDAINEVENEKILFSWEQFDLNAKEDELTFGPLFRSNVPSEKTYRTFPDLESILNNEVSEGERLPSQERNMLFRLTKRVALENDKNANGFAFDEMMVSVAGNATPFKLNNIEGSDLGFVIGKNYEVNWEVGNTDKAPINCSKVNISMSDDGGYTFPYSIGVNAINDGSFSFVFPNVESDKIRFKIEAVDNIFFDISDHDQRSFYIVEPFFNLDYELISADILCEDEEFVFLLKINNFNGFEDDIDFSLENIPSNSLPVFDFSTIETLGGITVRVSNLAAFHTRENNVKIIGTSGEQSCVFSIDFSINKMIKENPVLGYPIDKSILSTSSPLFTWSIVENANHYIVEISKDDSFLNIVESCCTNDNIYTIALLEENTEYFWRIVAEDNCWNTYTSAIGKFTTGTNWNYCLSETNGQFEWIEGFVLGNYNKFSGKNNGYKYFDSEYIFVNAGSNYKSSLYPGFKSQSWEENWQVALDANKDGFFSNDEILFKTIEATKTIVNTEFRIPDVESGNYTLRVMMFYEEEFDCEGTHYGEIEDYNLLIKNNCNDHDGDLICDAQDNCEKFNPEQVDQDLNGVGDACSKIKLDLKVFLQGAYLEGVNTMRTNLANLDLVPHNQPFDTDVYQYFGNESLLEIPENMVDWLLVEIRHGNPSMSGESTTSIIDRQAAILLNDGQILSVNNGLLEFDLTGYDNFSILIRHRNHIDVISSQQFESSDYVEYNFSANKEKALGANQQIELSNGFAAMYSGDFNQDGTIQNTDFDVWKLDPAKLNVYANQDANLDGVVQSTDFDAWVKNKSKNGIAEIRLFR